MKKSDIKTGMVIELADHDKFIILNTEVGKVGLDSSLSRFFSFKNYDEKTLQHKETTEWIEDVTQICSNEKTPHTIKVLTPNDKCPVCGAKFKTRDIKEKEIKIPRDPELDIVAIYSPKLDNNLANFERYKAFLAPACWDLMEKIWERKGV